MLSLEQKRQEPHYELKSGILKYRKNIRCSHKILVPLNMQTMIIRYHHDAATSAYLRIKKTVAREFAWEGMFQSIRDYVRWYELCQKSKQA